MLADETAGVRCRPVEFAELLSPRGRRVLEGKSPLAGILKTGTRFISERGLLDAAKCRRVLARLEADVKLVPFERGIPPESIWGLTRNYEELLPKTVRCHTSSSTAKLERGVLSFMRSDTFKQFAEVLSGRKLRKRWGTQVLAYGPGDYAGPHHDHHPEEPLARDGYTDVHLSLCTAGVKAQTLVYAPYAHFSEAASVVGPPLVTAYRLPFWHYTTPLQGRPGSRRWLLLGTFLDA
ncbi:MAG: hypothetical protein JNK82_35410 [Myxococcaceae bacterium]|nr:hypothetical protein [Myxococcaceae bacterium]